MTIVIPEFLIRFFCLGIAMLFLQINDYPGLLKVSFPSLGVLLAGTGLPLVLTLPRRYEWTFPELFIASHFTSLIVLAFSSMPLLFLKTWDFRNVLISMTLILIISSCFAAIFAKSCRIRITRYDFAWISASYMVFLAASNHGAFHSSGDCWVHLSAAKRLLEHTWNHMTDPMVAHSGVDIRYAWSLPAPLLATLSVITRSIPLTVWNKLPVILAPLSVMSLWTLSLKMSGSFVIAAISSLAQALLLIRAGSWAPEYALLSLPFGWAVHIGLPAAVAMFLNAIREKSSWPLTVLSAAAVTLNHLFYGLLLLGITAFSSLFTVLSSVYKLKKYPCRFRKSEKNRIIASIAAFMVVLSTISPIIALRISDMTVNNPFFLFDSSTSDSVNRREHANVLSTSVVKPLYHILATGTSSRTVLPVALLILGLICIKPLFRTRGFPLLAGSILMTIVFCHLPPIPEFIAHQITWMKVIRLYQGIPLISGISMVTVLLCSRYLFKGAAHSMRRKAMIPLTIALFLALAPPPEQMINQMKQQSPESALKKAALHKDNELGALMKALSDHAPGTVLSTPELSMLIPAMTHHKVYTLPIEHSSPSIPDMTARRMLYPFLLKTEYCRGLVDYLIQKGITYVVVPANMKGRFVTQELSCVWQSSHFEILTPRRIAESGVRV